MWKLDRLGRDLRHIVNTVHDLTAKDIGLKVLTGQGRQLIPEELEAELKREVKEIKQQLSESENFAK